MGVLGAVGGYAAYVQANEINSLESKLSAAEAKITTLETSLSGNYSKHSIKYYKLTKNKCKRM